MESKMLKYEMSSEIVNYILTALNRTQIVGVQGAKDLVAVTELLQRPLNADELEKDQYEALKSKFDTETKETKKK